MDLTSGLVIGRIRGIEIRVHWSWLAIATLLAWTLSRELFAGLFPLWSDEQQWAAGIVTTLLFFLSVLLHELSHAIVAQRYGMTVPSITLFIFGGVSTLADEMKSPSVEFRVAVAGPLMSGVLAIVCGLLWLVTRSHDLSIIPGYLAVINAVLGAFNLLPGFPLDGGRVLRAVVWGRTKDLLRATRIAALVGMGIAYTMIAGGLLLIFTLGLLNGLWYMLVGLFLRSAAEGAYSTLRLRTALRDVPASEVMQDAPEPVHASLSLERLIDERVLPMGERAFLVERGDSIVGLVTIGDVTRVARSEWPSTPVESAMIPSERAVTISPETRVVDALRLMQEHDIHQLPVLREGRVAGMLTLADVMRHVELRMVLSGDVGSDSASDGSTEAGHGG
jgi:Zn-dependent protease/CBS domain-containing protein